MRIRNRYIVSAAAACALGLGINPASAHLLTVGGCGSTTPVFSTIQAAVNSASPGDKVQVCGGASYPEQVVITQSLTLTTVPGSGTATITVPPGGVAVNATSLGSATATAAQILVAPTSTLPQTVNIKNLSIDGTGNGITGGCGTDLVGIYYQDASGTISGNTLTNQTLQDPALAGCQAGQGILVENATYTTDNAVNITGNWVSQFQKNGITFHLQAAFGTITRNVVTGIGPTPAIAQNGIEVAYNATAAVSLNTVSNLAYTGGYWASSGILLYSIPGAQIQTLPTIKRNIVTDAQYGIALDGASGKSSAALLQVLTNTVSGSSAAGIGLFSDASVLTYLGTYVPLSDDYIAVASNQVGTTDPLDGIDACSDYNLIKANVVNTATESGIHLDSTCQEPDSSTTGIGNTVTGNKVENSCVGILSGPASGANTISGTHDINVTHPTEFGTDTFSCVSPVFRATATKSDSSSQKVQRVPQPAHY